jgi:hypothetical protein
MNDFRFDKTRLDIIQWISTIKSAKYCHDTIVCAGLEKA